MQVLVDDVWSTKSTLHLRVTVSDDDGRWRHRFYPAVSLDQIPLEAIAPLVGFFRDTGGDEQQLLLFDL